MIIVCLFCYWEGSTLHIFTHSSKHRFQQFRLHWDVRFPLTEERKRTLQWALAHNSIFNCSFIKPYQTLLVQLRLHLFHVSFCWIVAKSVDYTSRTALLQDLTLDLVWGSAVVWFDWCIPRSWYEIKWLFVNKKIKK